MKTPNFLQDLISSPAYGNKNSPEYAQATNYMKLLYPGTVQFDATGKMVRPAYDMTLKQFEETQAKIEEDIQAAKEETEQELSSEEYGAESRNDPDNEPSVEIVLKELVDTKVLMPNGSITVKQLKIYDLEIISNEPDDDDEPEDEPTTNKRQTVWRWHSEQEENTCDECASHDGEIFLSEADIPEIPAHPNCRCSITEDVINEYGKTISSKPYKQKTQVPDKTSDNSSHAPTFKNPVNTEPGMYAKFDGKALTIYKNGQELYKFDAVSGKNGFQTPEYQDKKDTGPIPEGIYVARQSDLQHITPYGLIAGIFGAGTWRGSLNSWGSSRVWLEPSKETNTYGRDNLVYMGDGCRVRLAV